MYWNVKGTTMLLALMMLTVSGCVSGKIKASSRVCPAPIIITQEQQSVLRSELPDFYLRFTNQQLDLMEIDR